MIGKVKEISETGVTLEFKDGSIKSMPFAVLPDYITIDDSISLTALESTPNEKYIDYF